MKELKTYGNKSLWERIKNRLCIKSGWVNLTHSIDLKRYDKSLEEE